MRSNSPGEWHKRNAARCDYGALTEHGQAMTDGIERQCSRLSFDPCT